MNFPTRIIPSEKSGFEACFFATVVFVDVEAALDLVWADTGNEETQTINIIVMPNWYGLSCSNIFTGVRMPGYETKIKLRVP